MQLNNNILNFYFLHILGLTFLGCLFKCPGYNDTETPSLFPEVAVKTNVPKARNPVEVCYKKAKKLHEQVFGACNHTCITGDKLKLVLPTSLGKLKNHEHCADRLKIYSLVGEYRITNKTRV